MFQDFGRDWADLSHRASWSGVKSKKSAAAKTPDPLAEPLARFADGDYVTARRLLKPLAEGDGAESTRTTATNLINATHVDRLTLLTGLACLGVLVLAVLFTAFIQP